ncbi:hypothetical protein [Salinispora tropica]|uniref:Uncharacterized protein n=1 Tax=Salinispora tropica (strain ATCC BAA-916 / DSM 44818 / JCM 13857 / NBRC 105044 / CNB-440) TaxID=369723 RepID=A4X3Z5_SALTO|nr:hypothetical protein [Salinispora tropica]ABP53595.1 hypothetical protein Strop_1124 [Salinispora tropica CNB-440]
MRTVRVFAGVLLLVTGIPVLLGGAALGADLTLDLRAELRESWVAPVTAGLLVGGMLLVSGALALLLRPARPREVVFVVEPDQVPLLASRLGLTSLSGLGAPAARAGGQPVVARDGSRLVAPARQLVSVGASGEQTRSMPRPAGERKIGPVGRRRAPGAGSDWPLNEPAETDLPSHPGRPPVRRLRPSLRATRRDSDSM